MASSAKPALVLQHGDSGPPDLLERWLRERGLSFEVRHAWREPLPGDPAAYAWVASLGSQHSPAGGPAWVADAVGFLRRAVDDDVPVLGLCFGGQALAAAMGAEVRRAARGEVGWLELETTDPALIPPGPWLQFHWDVFDVPAGATEVARSAAGPAAFVAGPHLGLQFHPETGPAVADGWARAERERLGALGVTPESLLAQGRAVSDCVARNAFALLDAFLERAS